MKILIMDWPAFGGETVKRIFRELGHELFLFDFPHKSEGARCGEELGVKITEEILKTDAQIIFSFNFFPVIATAVHACRRKYVSWIYDSPTSLLFSMAVFFPENYIFHFDSYEANRLSRDGVEHVWYLPLAADTEKYDTMIPSDTDRERYTADIAMIGSLYREKIAFFEKYTRFDGYLKGYLDALIASQEQIYGADILEPALTPEFMGQILDQVPLPKELGDSYITPAWTFSNYYLGMTVTANEREHLLRALSEKYDVALYTTGEMSKPGKIRNLGSVDYYTEAPLAMKCAKINLNITLRSIHTGIPQRALDIMACGGFLLSNYQADLCDAFEPGEEFVIYESPEDAVEKCGYYLQHDDAREAIAACGYRKVKQEFGYRDKVRQILESVLQE